MLLEASTPPNVKFGIATAGTMLFEASAPGTLILLGEYAVLQGRPALVAAVDKRIKVKLIPRSDEFIRIFSSLGKLTLNRNNIVITEPFRFLLATFKKWEEFLPSGFDFEIQSDFSSKVGLGSSAAVIAATLAVLNDWLKLSLSLEALIKHGREIIRNVQGVGSGADIAASFTGGIVYYRSEPFTIEKINALFPITVIYSGSKLPTPDAIAKVTSNFQQHPDLFNAICEAIGTCAEEGKKALVSNDLIHFGKIMTIQQSLMDALGVSTPILREITEVLRNQETILGSKISGSGFGDSVIGLGSIETGNDIRVVPGEPIQVTISNRGIFA